MRLKIVLLFLASCFTTLMHMQAQVLTRDSTLVNLGSSIYVGRDNASVMDPALYIDGDYTNRDFVTTTNTFTGTIELYKGEIEVSGDWFNYSAGHVFTNLFGSSSDGIVTMSGAANPQFFAGSTPSHFENISLHNSDKYLLTDNNEINGYLRLDAVLDLNKRTLIIDNASPMAIEYVSKYIHSETSPVDGYGQLQWNIGASNFGTYNIPFGSSLSNTNDLNLQINIKQGGIHDNSNFVFATYPSDLYNTPFPENSTPTTKNPLSLIDRYWIIEPNFQQKPMVDIEFTYTQEDLKPTFNTLIDPPNLKAIRYDEVTGSWLSIPAAGKSTPGLNVVRIEDVQPVEFFTNWTLASTEVPFADIFIPDAFSPNADGLNDVFMPVVNLNYDITDYEFLIFDRFGRKIFQTDNYTEGWNGTIEGDLAPIGVYTYLIIIRGGLGKENHHRGHVTLVK